MAVAAASSGHRISVTSKNCDFTIRNSNTKFRSNGNNLD